IGEPLTDLRISLENAADGAEFSKIFMNRLLDEQKIMTSFTALSKADMGGEVHELIFDKEAAEESGGYGTLFVRPSVQWHTVLRTQR
ncbi:MAG: hypothetical protein K2N36_03845, partial [Ruminiclostridium sp.]|nr:hypothetical protein [Ruminiclostridium sp.]